MARTWAFLGRVLRVPVPVPVDAPAGGDGEADAEEHGAAEAVEAADAQAGGGDGEAAAAAQPGHDFSIALAEPPRITVMTAAPTAQPEPQYPDTHPYILCVHGDVILLNFGVEPFQGACFDDRPYQSHLVVVRNYHGAGVEQGLPITATAERIPCRDGGQAIVCNIESIGLISTFAETDYVIAELIITKRSEDATLIYYYEGPHSKWIEWSTTNPLPWREQPNREWMPSGVVSHNDTKTLWWFDLSWGIIGYDPRAGETGEPVLHFHQLPQGQDLKRAQRVHDRRCIAESRGALRYVAITPDADAGAATVSMWTWIHTVSVWEEEFAVSFAQIWDDESYMETGLPRKVPVLVGVCPTNANMVYFALEDPKRLFGVNMYLRRVEEFVDESYELLTPGPEAPPSCRYVLPWDLPLHVAQALGLDPLAPDTEDELLSDEEEEEEEDEVEQEVPEIEDEEQSELEDDPTAALEALFGPPVDDVVEELPEIKDSELPVDESSDEGTLSMTMDSATIARLRAELEEDRLERELEEERLRQSQNPPGPGDDAGEGASS